MCDTHLAPAHNVQLRLNKVNMAQSQSVFIFSWVNLNEVYIVVIIRYWFNGLIDQNCLPKGMEKVVDQLGSWSWSNVPALVLSDHRSVVM